MQVLETLKKRSPTFDSQETQLDEDALLDSLKPQLDAILAPNASLFKFYEMPSKFEGNLLLIMYLLGNTLDEIFERLRYEVPLVIPAIQDTQYCYGTVDQAQL